MDKFEKSTIIRAWNELEELSQFIENAESLDSVSYLIEERIMTAMRLLDELFTEEEAIEELGL